MNVSIQTQVMLDRGNGHQKLKYCEVCEVIVRRHKDDESDKNARVTSSSSVDEKLGTRGPACAKPLFF